MNVYVQVFRLKYGKRTLESNIEDYPKAKALKLYYGKQLGVNPDQFTIEPHTTQTKLSDELSHQILNAPSEVKQHLKSLRIITGKTLKDKALKTFNPNKYKPDQWQPKEVRFAQSAERGKGISTIAHVKDKKQKQTNIFDYDTARYINEYRNKSLSLSAPDRVDYINKIKSNYSKYNELFKHVRNTFHLSNNDTKKLLSDVKL